MKAISAAAMVAGYRRTKSKTGFSGERRLAAGRARQLAVRTLWTIPRLCLNSNAKSKLLFAARWQLAPRTEESCSSIYIGTNTTTYVRIVSSDRFNAFDPARDLIAGHLLRHLQEYRGRDPACFGQRDCGRGLREDCALWPRAGSETRRSAS